MEVPGGETQKAIHDTVTTVRGNKGDKVLKAHLPLPSPHCGPIVFC